MRVIGVGQTHQLGPHERPKLQGQFEQGQRDHETEAWLKVEADKVARDLSQQAGQHH